MVRGLDRHYDGQVNMAYKNNGEGTGEDKPTKSIWRIELSTQSASKQASKQANFRKTELKNDKERGSGGREEKRPLVEEDKAGLYTGRCCQGKLIEFKLKIDDIDNNTGEKRRQLEPLKSPF